MGKVANKSLTLILRHFKALPAHTKGCGSELGPPLRTEITFAIGILSSHALSVNSLYNSEMEPQVPADEESYS